MATQIVSRQEMLAKGLARYFTGKPCKHGHICERHPDGACCECKKKLNLEHYYRHDERIKKRISENYRKNPAPMIAKVQKWARENREQVRQNHRNWSHKNPGKVLANTRNQRARRHSAEGTHTADDVADILRLQRGKCANCLIKLIKYHVDHVVALINGGSNGRENLQILCGPCNHAKHAKDPILFAQENGRLL